MAVQAGKEVAGRISKDPDRNRLSQICRDQSSVDPRKATRSKIGLRIFSLSVERKRSDRLRRRRTNGKDAIHVSASAARAARRKEFLSRGLFCVRRIRKE